MSARKAHHHHTIEADTRGKERPILFSTDMVRAILAGRKTQTRRIIKPRNNDSIFVGWDDEFVLDTENKEWALSECPYGHPGDRLWVRETWLPGAWDAHSGMIKAIYKADIKKSGWIIPYPDDDDCQKFNHLWQSICDELDRKGIHPDASGMYQFNRVQKQPLSWRPSIHMPRAACRLLLQITDVRIERLNDITPADAIKEGCQYASDTAEEYMYTDWYKNLWTSINGPGSWEANPLVWVITFNPLPLFAETPPSVPPNTDPEPAAPAAAPPGQPPA